MPKRPKPYKPLKDWRDPNMPVSFSGKLNGEYGIHEIPHKQIREYYAYKMVNPFYDPPQWHSDPSYWWSKRGRSK